MLYTLPGIIIVSFMTLQWFDIPQPLFPLVLVVVVLLLFILFVGFSFKHTSSMMLDEGLDQSIEFLQDGIRYYQRKGFLQHLTYYLFVLFHKEEKYVHYSRYEDIQEVSIIVSKRYMNLGSPIAYEVYVPDFKFVFKDGHEFYFYWPMILDDDERYIAYILEDKIKNIKDDHHALYAMKNGINLHDYLKEQD